MENNSQAIKHINNFQLPQPNTIRNIHNALYIEHNVQRIITQQEENGVEFDTARANVFVRYLRIRQSQLYRQIRPLLSLELSIPYSRPVSRPYLATGGYSNQTKKWYRDEEIHRVAGPFTRVEWLEPDLGKRAKLAAQLLRMGWKPSSYTEKGNPQLTVKGVPCPSLSKIDNAVGKQIATWHIYRHRQSQIQGWLDITRDDGRITAQAITIGTPTFRFRHKGVVNVPKAADDVLFGKEMRSLFTTREGYSLVGHDASGLELRMLADAINDEQFTGEILNGDIHTKNQRDAKLPTRDAAKTFIYAFIYGAGDAKIGEIIGGSRIAGKRIRSQFLLANPKLASTITTTQRAAKRGYLIGLDGRRITLRRDRETRKIQTHKALNTRLQCAGAIVMKWSMVILDIWIRSYGLDALKVIDMHDESQSEVKDKDAQMVAALGPLSLVEAGKLLQLNIPLAGDSKIGNNWSETH